MMNSGEEMGSNSYELPGLSQTYRLVKSRLSTFGRPREGPGNEFPALEVIKTGHLVTRELTESLDRAPLNFGICAGFPMETIPEEFESQIEDSRSVRERATRGQS